MPNVHHGLLAVAALLLLAAGEGCAENRGAPLSLPSRPDDQFLIIDLAGQTASTPEWTASTSNCGDESYYCIAIPGHMVLAFPKSCRTALDPNRPPTRVGILKGVAPFPHLAPPSGGYVLERFPNLLLIYLQGRGLSEVRNTRHSPKEAGFDFEDYTIRYVIRTKDDKPLFACR
jgi:hypothetical protein